MNFRQTRSAESVYLNNLEYAMSDLMHYLSSDDLNQEDLQATIEHFTHDPRFNELANQAAYRMITAQKVENAKSWREAAMKGTNGRAIYNALKREVMTGFDGYVQHLVMQNAELIKTLPRDIARDVNAMILQWTMEGLRAEEIAERLKEKVPHGVKSNLQLIARTELSKANSAITQARCQEMDIQWYTWQTAKDGDRVRPSHRHMQGVLVPWNNPPNPEALLGIRSAFGNYHAGGCPNCRCYAEPVVAIELLPESFKIYTGGGIETMNRTEFQRLIAA